MQVNATTLAAQPFLEGLSERQLAMLADDATFVEFKTGELIFSEGAPANRFYLLTQGAVALESSNEKYEDERAPVLIETIGPGAALGWSWLFPPYHWHFGACAVTPVKAIVFYGTRLREQCENDHDLGYELTKRMTAIVIERLQAVNRRLSEQNKNLLASV